MADGRAFQPGDHPTLLVFWSSTCPHCCQELADFSQRGDEFRQARLDVLAICLDELNESTAERR